MSVSNTKTRTFLTGNGTAGPFAFDFDVQNDDQVQVWVNNKQRIDFTVNLANNTITFTDDENFPENGAEILIARRVGIRQTIELPEAGLFPSTSVERALDRLTLIAQENRELAERSLRFRRTSPTKDKFLPEPETGKFLRWNASADGLENAELVTLGDVVLSNSNPTDVSSRASIAGVSQDVARADHVHKHDIILNVKDFGAVGNGVADDTAAIQAAIDATVVADAALYFPPGTYIVSSTLTVSGRLRIFSSHRDSATIRYNQTSGDLFNINTASAFTLDRITLQGQNNAVSGALVKIAPAIGSGNFRSTFRDVNFVNHFTGIEATAAHSWTVDNCYFNAQVDKGIITGNSQNTLLGRNNIINSSFVGPGATGTGIFHKSGSSLKINNCFFTLLATGYHLEWDPGAVLGGDLFIANSHFGNLGACIFFNRITGEFANVHISNNLIHGRFCIVDNGSPADWLYDLVITGNGIFPTDNGIGVSLNANPWAVTGNIFDGGGSTNTTGVNIASAAVNVVISGNLFTALTTPLADAATGNSLSITGNQGIPIEVSSVMAGDSPYTYTAKHRPETLYIIQSSGDVGISQGGQTIATDAGSAIPITIHLEPNESIVISWNTNPPTFTKVIH